MRVFLLLPLLVFVLPAYAAPIPETVASAAIQENLNLQNGTQVNTIAITQSESDLPVIAASNNSSSHAASETLVDSTIGSVAGNANDQGTQYNTVISQDIQSINGTTIGYQSVTNNLVDSRSNTTYHVTNNENLTTNIHEKKYVHVYNTYVNQDGKTMVVREMVPVNDRSGSIESNRLTETSYANIDATLNEKDAIVLDKLQGVVRALYLLYKSL